MSAKLMLGKVKLEDKLLTLSTPPRHQLISKLAPLREKLVSPRSSCAE